MRRPPSWTFSGHILLVTVIRAVESSIESKPGPSTAVIKILKGSGTFTRTMCFAGRINIARASFGQIHFTLDNDVDTEIQGREYPIQKILRSAAFELDLKPARFSGILGKLSWGPPCHITWCGMLCPEYE